MLRPSTLSVFSAGYCGPMSKACGTAREPAFSCFHKRGRSRVIDVR
jgi:hypothetical protein